MRKLLLVVSMAMVVMNAIGQTEGTHKADIDGFVGLRSEGLVPADLRLNLDELYTLDKQRVRDYTDGKLPNRDKVLNASYHINRLMASGRVLYGDPITRLVERIADTLLKDYPQLRSELRFYTIKSPEVNAFATGQGMVFVCTGLVAQVDDEAQLAFVISHEIIHYLKKHSLEDITRSKRDSRDIEAETQEMRDFIKYHNRSREMESEADSLGIALFYLESPYDKNVSQGFFDVLQYGYLPFDEVPFDTAFFNTPYYKMPAENFLDSLSPITARDDYDDSLSTHPNILKRRTATAAVLSAAQGGSSYVVSDKEEFERLRTLARMECVRQDLVNAEYARAFYDCYMLLRQYPDNAFVNKAFCQSLYGLSKHKTYTSTSSVVGNYLDFEGEVQQSYYFFRKIKKEDLALVTARQLWKSHRSFPNDKQITAMMDDIFADLYEMYGYNADFFASTFDTVSAIDTTAQQSKYQKLKHKKKKLQDTRMYAFTDLIQDDPDFKPYMESHLRKHDAVDVSLDPKERQIVYNPSYRTVNLRSGELKIKRSNRSEIQLGEQIAEAAAAAGIESENFSDKSLHDMTTAERYNEFVDIVEWVKEFWATEGKFDMLNSKQADIDRICSKYDVGSINMTVVMNAENLHIKSKGRALWALVVPPLAPVIIESAITSSEATIVHSVQIDAQHGRSINKSTYVYKYSDEPSRVTDAIYDHYQTTIDSTRHVPGYLGSRFILTASGTLGIANLSTSNNTGAFPRRSLVNMGAGLNAGYVVGRKTILELSGNYIPMAYNNTVDFDYYSAYLNLRSTLGDNLAPLGRSFAFGIGIGDCILKEAVDGEKKDNLFFGVHLDLSRHYMLSRHWSLGYTIQYNLMKSIRELTSEDMESNVFLTGLFRIGLTIGFIP